jgi:UDP-N-acetylmuramoyl-L-alanyl-D-glutamate--2,6-diaminopimelate ligase
MQALMDGAQLMAKRSKNIITLLGAEGGGRDEVKRPIMGEIAMRGSDYVVLTNVDPYRDDPEKIIDDIAVGVEKAGGKLDATYFRVTDRRAGIRQALKLAQPGDVVFITGKGSEQSIVIDGRKSQWDDRKVVREELNKILKSPSEQRD